MARCLPLFTHLLVSMCPPAWVVQIFMPHPIFHSISLYGGLLLFTGYIAYDTQVAISSYEEGDRDHVSHSLNFFVNFVAIFRRMMEVLSYLVTPSLAACSRPLPNVSYCAAVGGDGLPRLKLELERWRRRRRRRRPAGDASSHSVSQMIDFISAQAHDMTDIASS